MVGQAGEARMQKEIQGGRRGGKPARLPRFGTSETGERIKQAATGQEKEQRGKEVEEEGEAEVINYRRKF